MKDNSKPVAGRRGRPEVINPNRGYRLQATIPQELADRMATFAPGKKATRLFTERAIALLCEIMEGKRVMPDLLQPPD